MTYRGYNKEKEIYSKKKKRFKTHVPSYVLFILILISNGF